MYCSCTGILTCFSRALPILLSGCQQTWRVGEARSSSFIFAGILSHAAAMRLLGVFSPTLAVLAFTLCAIGQPQCCAVPKKVLHMAICFSESALQGS